MFWSLIPRIDRAEALEDLLDRAGTPGWVVDEGRSGGLLGQLAYQPQVWPIEHRRAVLAHAPATRLSLPVRWPMVDYAYIGPELVSRRLRDAFAIEAGDVFYGDVDSSGGPATARNADFRTLHVLHYANPIDPARTAGRAIHLPGADGAWTTEWQPTFASGPNAGPNPIYWQEDFTPPAPIFAVPGANFTLVTEALADRVMRAGITDVEFMDISGPQQFGDIRLRAR